MSSTPNTLTPGPAVVDRSLISAALSDLIGVAENAAVKADPVAFLRALASAGVGVLQHPLSTVGANYRFLKGLAAASVATGGRAVGLDWAGPISPPPGDQRFNDPAYRDNPAYFLLAQQYLLVCRLVTELLDAAGLAGIKETKARFAAQFLLDAISPTNTLAGNPAAIRRVFDTGGKSVIAGARNMLHDVRHNGGWPSQVDRSGFEVGVNMAATPGVIVYRSDLIELIQYTPQTPTVHSIPLLFCPAWINKYYILDLAPGKSLIEWAIQHGHTCFAISYRNPDESMRELGFEDYMFKGPLDAVRVVREITGAHQVNTLSVCLGGTLTALALAHHAAIGDDSIRSATLLNTLTDFSEPGVLGTFSDEPTIKGLEKQMAKQGYLDSEQMARTFSALRANDLIFAYIANNWLSGNKPPAFDLLAWNEDSTRMPAKMHSQYLRSCYVNNEFAQGEFKIDSERLDPSLVKADTYVLAAIDDHIVPWTSSYRTTQILGGTSRFVLSTAGHIAGIVNPPSPKAKHWTNDDLPPDALDWKTGATLQQRTWWEDWTAWIAGRGGPEIAAPDRHGSDNYPALEDAPGTYVRTAD